jgi:hypothetical protein
MHEQRCSRCGRCMRACAALQLRQAHVRMRCAQGTVAPGTEPSRAAAAASPRAEAPTRRQHVSLCSWFLFLLPLHVFAVANAINLAELATDVSFSPCGQPTTLAALDRLWPARQLVAAVCESPHRYIIEWTAQVVFVAHFCAPLLHALTRSSLAWVAVEQSFALGVLAFYSATDMLEDGEFWPAALATLLFNGFFLGLTLLDIIFKLDLSRAAVKDMVTISDVSAILSPIALAMTSGE